MPPGLTSQNNRPALGSDFFVEIRVEFSISDVHLIPLLIPDPRRTQAPLTLWHSPLRSSDRLSTSLPLPRRRRWLLLNPYQQLLQKSLEEGPNLTTHADHSLAIQGVNIFKDTS